MKTLILTESTAHRDPKPVVAALRAGGVVVIPTDTVYGLAAHPERGDAVEALFKLKGRDALKAVPLLVSDTEAALRVAEDAGMRARKLMDAFWPGPLTLVLPARRGAVPDALVTPDGTVGLRVPDRDVTRAVIRVAGGILAVTSANPSGAPESTSFEDVLKYFDGAVSCIVDGGACPGGVPSTVVAWSAAGVSILREGALNRETIENCIK